MSYKSELKKLETYGQECCGGTSCFAILVVLIGLLTGLAAVLDALEEEEGKGQVACINTVNMQGTWRMNYSCTPADGSAAFNGTEVAEVNMTANHVTFHVVGESDIFSGEMCHNIVTWSGTTADYDESGTWSLSGTNSFVKESSYTSRDGSNRDSGSCTGTGTRE